MIEDGTKRTDCVFCFTPKECIKSQSDPRFKSATICSETMTISFLKKKKIRLNQNWAVGYTILELSKLHMMQLYYEVIKPAFGNQVSVLLTDTDSWFLLVKGNNTDEVLGKIKNCMDFSNFSKNHKYFDESKKNMVGYLKNEVPNDSIILVVAIRSKTYAWYTKGEDGEYKTKGVCEKFKKNIKMTDFFRCLTSTSSHMVQQCSLLSKSHIISLVSAKKIAFSSFDDKRYLLCPIHSVPYGSTLIDMHVSTKTCIFCLCPFLLP